MKIKKEVWENSKFFFKRFEIIFEEVMKKVVNILKVDSGGLRLLLWGF